MTHLEKYAFSKKGGSAFNMFQAAKFMGQLPKLLPKVTKAVKNWTGEQRNIIRTKKDLNQLTKLDKKLIPDTEKLKKFFNDKMLSKLRKRHGVTNLQQAKEKFPGEFQMLEGLDNRLGALPKSLRRYADGGITPTPYQLETPVLKQLWNSTAQRLPGRHNYMLGAQSAVQDFKGLLGLGG
jgi:hypothetical protein